MTKSSSCFKIIACGGGNAGASEDDGVEATPENKSSGDRRGWSFRKRSARHRLLSNSVSVETSSDGNKESPESRTRSVQPPTTPAVPEKTSRQIWTEEKKAQLSASGDTNTVAAESMSNVDSHLESENKVQILDESLVVVIQTAIRGFLARRALTKLKSLVKIQAAVRRHLVRKHAVGTLRCLQAIFKMQALVRARNARLALQRAYTGDKVAGSDGKGTRPLGNDHSVRKSNVGSTPIDTLLSNSFAQQLLESTPKFKPMYIKCDPLRPNLAWKWLERWMSVSSSPPAEPVKLELNSEKQKSKEVEHCTVVAAEESADSMVCLKETTIQFKPEELFITSDVRTIGFQSHHPNTSGFKDNLDQPGPENADVSDMRETLLKRDENSKIHLKSVHPKPKMESGQSMRTPATEQLENEKFVCGSDPKPTMENGQSMKTTATEQLENEKFVCGSGKVSSPTFSVAQSKFKDLSLVASSAKSIDASYQDAAVESNLETVSSAVDSVTRSKEVSLADSSAPHISRVQVSSECGIELCVTSTSDSPDLSDLGAIEYEHEVKILEEELCDNNSKNVLGVGVQYMPMNPESIPSLPSAVKPGKNCNLAGEFANPAAEFIPAYPESIPSGPSAVQPGKMSETAGEYSKSVAVGGSTHVIASDMQMELGTDTAHLVYHPSSPEGSPRSHVTVPESQGTPSSQVSVNAKGKRANKRASDHKTRSLSASKVSPKNPSHDSGAKSSMEQLPKDQKVGKRRSSFGSEKAENVDQEPRVSSSSSNSLPSYMQPTESARAKAHASNSPRLSPDVQDKALYVKKRHSLPGANERQGSPLTQQSTPQIQGVKGNGAHSPHDRKWQR